MISVTCTQPMQATLRTDFVKPSIASITPLDAHRRGTVRSRISTQALFGFGNKKTSSNCGTCKGEGAITCKGCKGSGRNKKNGNMFERWKCYDCQGFGLVKCPKCGKAGLTPEQRGER